MNASKSNLSKKQILKNRYGFGIGTIGRDAVYTMISMYLMFYVTDILEVPDSIMATITLIIMSTRIFDAVNDPFMGVLVDNTHSKFGKFKPWIGIGAVLSSVFTVIMFTNFNLSGGKYILVFTLSYLLWEICFTANDIAFWGMLPSLSQSQKEREKIGGVARICANLGMFSMVVGVIPITKMIGAKVGSIKLGYTYLAAIAVIIMLIFQFIMLFLVKEENVIVEKQNNTKVSDMIFIIFKNDQLLWITVSTALFMTGYGATTGLGIYYFKYVFGNEDMYSVFALILGISQITALVLFPMLSKKFERDQLYLAGTILVVLGYICFFFAPTSTMLFIGIAGVLIFIGQALIQLLMLMFITDTVEYGEWKFGARNESVTLSLQAFIYKLGGALGMGIVGLTLILSGIRKAGNPSDLTPQGLIIFKIFFMIIPLLLIVVGFLIYKSKFKINKEFYDKILKEINEKNKSK